MFRHNSSTSSSKEILETRKKKRILVAKLLLVFAFVVWFVAQATPQYLYGYEASMIDKVDRLESTEGARIVLLGNSNLAFGVRSDMIEEAFGMTVVNMGLHGAQGKAFIEQAAKLDVHEGDIYVLCHSELSDDDTIPDPMLVWLTIEDHFDLWRLVRWKDWGLMLENYPTYLKKCLTLELNGTGNRNTGGAYTRTAFNEYGDVDYPRGLGEFVFTEGSVPEPVINETCVNRINELNAYLQERGATLVVAGYPIADGAYTPDRSLYEQFQQEAEAALDCPVISTYTDYFLDYKYFYDTYMHLTNAGAVLRTRQLIQDLDDYLGENAQVRGQMIYVGDGFYQTDVSDSINFRDAYQWNWSTQDSTLYMYNFDESATTVQVQLHVESVTESSELTVVTPDGSYTFPLNNTEGTDVTFPWTVQPGDNAIQLHCDALEKDPSGGDREVSFRILWDKDTAIQPYVAQE